MTKPKILDATWPYFQKFLIYHGLKITPTSNNPDMWGGDQQKVKGFTDYNFLLDINSCLSSKPGGLVRDTTNSIKFPFLTEPGMLWRVPTTNPDLETCFKSRVKQIEQNYQTVNLMWSGGIDSTSMVVAWLLFAEDSTKIRVLYTIDSIKENTGFFLHLQTVNRIELLEIGGSVFYNNNLDGVEIHGGGGDDITASIDESFFKTHGWWGLNTPWKDFFWKKIPDQKFIDFCEKWFSESGREVSTLLHARWWMYLNKMKPSTNRAWIVTKDSSTAISFFSDPMFVTHFYHRIDSLISFTSWNTYKQSIKDFIHNYHPDENYRINKRKENSSGYVIVRHKSTILHSKEYICIMADGELVRTDNLPFLSAREYRKKYGNQLDYLFGQPDEI